MDHRHAQVEGCSWPVLIELLDKGGKALTQWTNLKQKRDLNEDEDKSLNTSISVSILSVRYQEINSHCDDRKDDDSTEVEDVGYT